MEAKWRNDPEYAQKMIDLLRQLGKKNRGTKRGPMSQEVKDRIKKALKGKKRGPLTLEQRKKLSEAHKGRVVTAETRKKLSDARKRRGPARGWHHSAESRARIGNSNRGRKKTAKEIEKIRQSLTGRQLPAEHRRNISLGQAAKKARERDRKLYDKAIIKLEPTELEFWQIAQNQSLIPPMLRHGFITDADKESLERFFLGKMGRFPKVAFDKLSVGVANLA